MWQTYISIQKVMSSWLREVVACKQHQISTLGTLCPNVGVGMSEVTRETFRADLWSSCWVDAWTFLRSEVAIDNELDVDGTKRYKDDVADNLDSVLVALRNAHCRSSNHFRPS